MMFCWNAINFFIFDQCLLVFCDTRKRTILPLSLNNILQIIELISNIIVLYPNGFYGHGLFVVANCKIIK